MKLLREYWAGVFMRGEIKEIVLKGEEEIIGKQVSNWNGGAEGNVEEEYGEDQLILKSKIFLKRHRNLLLDLYKHTQRSGVGELFYTRQQCPY